MRVLVLGATGGTGRCVVDLLRADGVAVRASSRDPDRARATLGEVEVVRADLRDPDSLVGLGEGVDAVISCVGTRSYFGANGGAAVDARGTAHLVAALEGSGVHLVLLSAFGVDRRHLGLSAFSLALGNYFAHKRAAEAAVMNSELPWTVVRPVELRDRAPRPVRLVQGEPMSLLSAVRGVSREAVARVLVAAVHAGESVHGTAFELFEGEGGPIAEQLASLGPGVLRPPRTPLW